MHTRWLRAPRSAAHRLPTPRQHVLERGATSRRRLFSSTSIARQTQPTGDNGGKPDKGGDGSSGTPGESPNEARDTSLNEAENVSQDDSKITSEGQGRRRRNSPSSLRSRLLRSRSTQEVPPIELSKTFLDHAITRHEDLRKTAASIPKDELDKVDHAVSRNFASRLKSGPHSKEDVKGLEHILDEAAWHDENVELALSELSKGQTDRVRVRADLIVAAAHWSLAYISKEVDAKHIVTELSERIVPASAMLNTVGCQLRDVKAVPSLKADFIEYHIDSDLSNRRTVAAIEPMSLEELLWTLRSEFEIKAPPRAKSMSGLQRPATLARFDFTSGSTMPRDVIKYAAEELGADVLYLTPQSLAFMLGDYLGQDVTRSPSLLTQLGFRAAFNSGKIKPRKLEEAEEEDGGLSGLHKTLTIVVGQEKKKAGNKTSPLVMMDQYLNGSSSQEKNDERWEDLKLNTAIEEILHTALPEDPKRPLLVHVHDFVALSMDSESGNALLGRLRRITDKLWLDGRKVALLGSCSPLGAPEPYHDALAATTATERVVNIVCMPFSMPGPQDPKSAAPLPHSDSIDLWLENMVNLGNVLAALVPEHADALLDIPAELAKDPAASLDKTPWQFLPEWTSGILPLPEIYRAATVIIGSSVDSDDLASLKRWSTSMMVIHQTDEFGVSQTMALRELYRSRDKGSQNGGGGIFAAMGKIANQQQGGGADGGDHEKRLLSGLIQAKDIRTTFKDVHAPKETIESIQMLTTLSLIRPEAFSYGVLATDRIPGCLLYGPPGTGKTLLAKAVAKESGANMIEVSGASINNMYVGESEKNVRALFQLAKKKSPAVIFIDEADALLGSRGGGGGGGGGGSRGSRRETLNQFLREWDGMEQTKAFIMVATNRPFDLDEAVLRRLPRRLLIDLPTEKDRAAILGIHLKGETLDGGVDLAQLAKQTPLYSGSDLKNVCVAAAMAAVKEEIEGAALGGGSGGHESTDANSNSNPNPDDDNNNSGRNSDRSASPSSPPDNDGDPSQHPPQAEAPPASAPPPPPPPRRVLRQRHFDKALKEISASMSDDMATLAAIKKFDERYGDGMKRKPKKGMGFDILKGEEAAGRDVNEGRVRRI